MLTFPLQVIRFGVIDCKVSKAVPLNAMKALGGGRLTYMTWHCLKKKNVSKSPTQSRDFAVLDLKE